MREERGRRKDEEGKWRRDEGGRRKTGEKGEKKGGGADRMIQTNRSNELWPLLVDDRFVKWTSPLDGRSLVGRKMTRRLNEKRSGMGMGKRKRKMNELRVERGRHRVRDGGMKRGYEWWRNGEKVRGGWEWP
jgi:hypothetical protein